jgi:hypothetical protein
MTSFVKWDIPICADCLPKENSAMANETVNGKPLMDKENQEHQQQETTPPLRGPREPEEPQQEGIRDRAEALAVKLAHTYEELTRLLERNPGVKRQMTEGSGKEEKVYQKLKQRLKLADMAPRCRWVRQDGTSCRSPQMKQHIYCFAHMQMAEARALMLMLPPPEDANAIQIGLMRIQKSLIEDTISTKKAGLLLYSMQLALTNVGQTTFGQAKDEEMVRDTVDEEEAFSEKALSSQHSAVSQDQHPPRRHGGTEEEKGLPRMDADERGLGIGESGHREIGTSENQNTPRMDAEKNQDLPLMNTDDTDFGEAGGEESSRDREFVHVPGGYGFERVRLRIEPGMPGERRPTQAVIAPEERAEVHADMG